MSSWSLRAAGRTTIGAIPRLAFFCAEPLSHEEGWRGTPHSTASAHRFQGLAAKTFQALLPPVLLITPDKFADVLTGASVSATVDLFFNEGFHHIRKGNVHRSGHGLELLQSRASLFTIRPMANPVNSCYQVCGPLDWDIRRQLQNLGFERRNAGQGGRSL